MGSRSQGIADGITEAWTIIQKPNTNGYTLDTYLGIKARYERFYGADLRGQATPYQMSYLDGFDSVAIKLGFTGDEEEADDL